MPAAIGAVNTLVRDRRGGYKGYNTDARRLKVGLMERAGITNPKGHSCIAAWEQAERPRQQPICWPREGASQECIFLKPE